MSFFAGDVYDIWVTQALADKSMPLILTTEMRRHFHETGTLEVEGLLSDKMFSELKSSLQRVIPRSNLSFSDRYMLGHDLFRTEESIRRLEMRKEILHFLAELTQSRYLHLACDQLFDFRGKMMGNLKILPDAGPFAEFVSINPLLISMLVCLEGEGEPIADCPYPTKPGNVTFFTPEMQVNWTRTLPEGRCFLFVAYAARGAVIRFSPRDPHTSLLKRMDYQEFSPIEGRTHPLFRL